MSAEQKIKDNTSNKEVLSKNPKTVTGDIYVQDVHKYFGVTRALNGVNSVSYTHLTLPTNSRV